jgi:hypothetical protein
MVVVVHHDPFLGGTSVEGTLPVDRQRRGVVDAGKVAPGLGEASGIL